MKFKFCSDGDCPQWALAALHATSTLPALVFRRVLDCVVAGQGDDDIMEILKDTKLSSRDEAARAAAVLRWCLHQAWSSSCPGAQLTKDLLVLGVPRSHAMALADAADEGRAEHDKLARQNGFSINKVKDVTVSPGPTGSINMTTLNIFTDDMKKHELLINKGQIKDLVKEMKSVVAKMEEYESV